MDWVRERGCEDRGAEHREEWCVLRLSSRTSAPVARRELEIDEHTRKLKRACNRRSDRCALDTHAGRVNQDIVCKDVEDVGCLESFHGTKSGR